MRRVWLTIAMLLMGLALIGGATASFVGSSFAPLDQEVGTHGAAAGAVLGLGLVLAAFNPRGNAGWVRAGILYGFVVLAFETGSYFILRQQVHLGPVFFGLACSLALIALYPERRSLVTRTQSANPATPATPARKPDPDSPPALTKPTAGEEPEPTSKP